MGVTPDNDMIDALVRQRVDEIFSQKLEEKLAQLKANRAPSMTIIATKGTLDWAYPPFILASTAAALGYETQIFFTFYGLSLLKKKLNLKVSPLGNPAMPMKMPFGPKWFQGINWNMPNALMASVPGFESLATVLMKQTVKNCGVATIDELRDLCREADVKMLACQMTVELFGFKHSDFIDGLEFVGAATFFEFAGETDVCLFI